MSLAVRALQPILFLMFLASCGLLAAKLFNWFAVEWSTILTIFGSSVLLHQGMLWLGLDVWMSRVRSTVDAIPSSPTQSIRGLRIRFPVTAQ